MRRYELKNDDSMMFLWSRERFDHYFASAEDRENSKDDNVADDNECVNNNILDHDDSVDDGY